MSTGAWHPSVPQINRLSPPISIATHVAVPQVEAQIGQQPQGSKINVHVSSELMTYRARVEYFKASSKIKLLHSLEGKPVILALTDKFELCLLQLGVHRVQGWSCADLTPAGTVVTTFDVCQTGNTLRVAVACRPKASGSVHHELRYAKVKLDLLQLDGKDQKWIRVADNEVEPVGNVVIWSLLCHLKEPAAPEGLRKFEIVVGSSVADGSSSQFGTCYYRVDPKAGDGNGARWSVMEFPGPVSALVQQSEPLTIAPIGDTFVPEQGMVSVLRDFAQDGRCSVFGHITQGVGRAFEFRTDMLGDVRSVFSHRNPWGRTDLFIASNRGIGYYSSFAPSGRFDNLAKEPILPRVAFRQVFCSEETDADAPDMQSKLSVFAISDDGSLYYIDGTRLFDAHIPTFSASGLPIRTGVTHASAIYSSKHRTSELLYGVEHESALFYLRRDPGGQHWLEDRVSRPARTFIKYDAFVSVVSVTDEAGGALGGGVTLQLLGDHIEVMVNSRSIRLSPMYPTNVCTDATGCVELVQPAGRRLGCLPIQAVLRRPGGSLGAAADTFAFDIDSSSRVSRLICEIRGVDKLKEALDLHHCNAETTGRLAVADAVLSQFDDMRAAAARPDAPYAPNLFARTDSDESRLRGFLGDCIEASKMLDQHGPFKLGVNMLDSVVMVSFCLCSKVFLLNVTSVYSLLEILGRYVQMCLGWDGLDRLLTYCKVVIDPKSVQSTQLFLGQATTASVDLVGRFLDVNRDNLSSMFDNGADWLREYVEDTRLASQGPVSNIVTTVMNNPVVRNLMTTNPLMLIIDAATHELPGLQTPLLGDVAAGVASVFSGAVDRQLEALDKVVEAFCFEIETLAEHPIIRTVETAKRAAQAVVCTLFDSIRDLMEAMHSALTSLVRSLGPVLDGAWKMPGVTDLWEDLTGQDFTLLGAITFMPAVVLNFVSTRQTGRLPFEGATVPSAQDVDVRPLRRPELFEEFEENFEAPGAPTAAPFSRPTMEQASVSENSGDRYNLMSVGGGLMLDGGEGSRGSSNLTFGRVVEAVANMGRVSNAICRSIQAIREENARGAQGVTPGRQVLPNAHPIVVEGQDYAKPIVIDEQDGGHLALPPPPPEQFARLLWRKLTPWMSNIGRLIGATGNFAFAIWHMAERQRQNHPSDLAMLGFSCAEFLMVVLEIRGDRGQGLRVMAELIGRGGAIARMQPVREWELGQASVSLSAATSAGVSAETLRMWCTARYMIIAKSNHAVDMAASMRFLVAVTMQRYDGGETVDLVD